MHTFKCLLFVLAQCFGDIDANVYDKVALAISITLNCRKSLTTKTEHGAGLCSRLNVDVCLSVDGRYLCRSAECCFRNGEEKVVDKVVFITEEFGMRLFFDKHLNVSRYSAMTSCITLTTSSDYHAVLYASGDFDFYDFFACYNTLAMTMLTLILDDGAFAVT